MNDSSTIKTTFQQSHASLLNKTPVTARYRGIPGSNAVSVNHVSAPVRQTRFQFGATIKVSEIEFVNWKFSIGTNKPWSLDVHCNEQLIKIIFKLL